MREVLYTKYNSRRRPIFQLSTSIIEDGGKRYAQKKAIQPRAEEHLRNMVTNRSKLEALYKDIALVECIEEEDGLLFPFVDGSHLLDDVLVVNDSLEGVIASLNEGLARIASYKEDMKCEFTMTEGFAEVFKGCHPTEGVEAIMVSNIDAIFDNFVELEDGSLCCLDYEWVLDFPVPLRYITFRNVYYFYHDNETGMKKWIEKEEFYQKLGYTEEEIALYSQMEEAFQQYVHGEGWEYLFLGYDKKTIVWEAIEGDMKTAKDLPMLEEQIEHLKGEVKEWIQTAEMQQEYIQKMRKAIKNPFFALSWMGEKVMKKIKK